MSSSLSFIDTYIFYLQVGIKSNSDSRVQYCLSKMAAKESVLPVDNRHSCVPLEKLMSSHVLNMIGRRLNR